MLREWMVRLAIVPETVRRRLAFPPVRAAAAAAAADEKEPGFCWAWEAERPSRAISRGAAPPVRQRYHNMLCVCLNNLYSR